LDRTVESPQDLEGARHGLRVEAAIMKHSFAQASNLAVLVKGDEAAIAQFGNAQPN